MFDFAFSKLDLACLSEDQKNMSYYFDFEFYLSSIYPMHCAYDEHVHT